MAEILTSAQMRAVESAEIESGAVSGLVLMERAGAAVVAAALDTRPALGEGAHRACVLCGPGNNGGDGFVVARLLHDRGWQVETWLLGDAARLPPDARANHDAWAERGAVVALDDPARGLGDGGFGPQAPDLIIDALFGTGLSRPMPAAAQHAVEGIRFWRERVRRYPLIVAVDVPSGLCADSGRALGTAMCADLTVAFHRAKPGHYLGEGPRHCGALVVAGIGLPDTPVPGAARLAEGAAARLWLAKRHGHKFRHGHALVLSGGAGRSGAARLAARAALRIGAGLVTVGAPPAAMPECAAHLTAVMLREIADAGALCDTLLDARINAVCLGPGLGHGAGPRALVLTTLEMAQGSAERGVVLDADALTQFSGPMGGAAELFALTARVPRCVLTPHDGEFARLFPDLAAQLEGPATIGPAFSRLDAVRMAAARAGCVVLLKGPDTVISAPDGSAAIHAAAYERAAPWLATAGSGDVLAGMITGMMARGGDAHAAACTSAWMHVQSAHAFGPGLIAEDLPETLPQVLRNLPADGH